MFLVQYPEMWGSLASIHAAMLADRRFRPLVMTLPTRDRERGDGCGRDLARPALAARGVATLDAAPPKDWTFRPDLILLCRPFEGERPDGFHSWHLSRIARLVYVPYGFEVGGGFAFFQYNQAVHRLAWRIFARSRRQKRMFARHCPRGDAHVVASGHPKIDQILAARRRPLEEVVGVAAPSPTAKVFVYTPHFSLRVWEGPPWRRRLTGTGWSTFRDSWPEFLDCARRHPDHLFVFRPHPLLRSFSLVHGLISAADWGAIDRAITVQPNLVLHDADDYPALFAASDALITDLSSFLYEYLPTGKPVLYLHNPAGPGLDEEGRELVANYYGGTIGGFVDLVIGGEDAMHGQRQVAAGEFLEARPEGNGRWIAESIAAALSAEAGHHRPRFDARVALEPLAFRLFRRLRGW